MTANDDLVAAARVVRDRAHAPYSGYRVGAALRTKSGRVFSGCNIENASFGATICAERSAVAQMVAAGEVEIVAIAVFTEGDEPGTPCGICRQVLFEFGADIDVVCATPSARRDTTIAALLPAPFSLKP